MHRAQTKHKTQNTEHKRRVWALGFRKFVLYLCFVSLGFVFLAKEAEAGFIVQRPLYIGLTSGLVGYWSFDAMSLGTSSASDLSGNSNTGFFVNGPTKTIGRIGQALNFDGSDDYINLGRPSSFNSLIRNISVAAWIKKNTLSGVDRIVGVNRLNSSNGFGFGTSGSGLRFTTFGTKDYDSTTITLSTGIWYHVVAVMDSDFDVTFYVNGVSRQTITHTASGKANTDDDFYLGASTAAGTGSPPTEVLDGLLDEVRIYNRALSPEEVRRLYHQGATTKFNSSQKYQLTSGLVGYWSFDAMSLGTSSASDLSGNSNTGFFVNAPTRALGRIGQALSFDGSNDYVNVGSGSSLANLGSLSISAWIYPKSTGEGTRGRITDKDTPLATGGWLFHPEGTTGPNRLRFTGSHTTTDLNVESSDNAITLNKWQHVLVTWDGTTNAANAHLYIDGRESSYSVQTNGVGTRADDSGRALFIGEDVSGIRAFNGLIDEVRVYNRALSPEEVRRLYHQGATTKFNTSQKYQLTNGLVGYWSFDAMSLGTSSASDLSGNSNTGFFTNGPTKAIGRIGQALNFDGSNDLVNAGSAAILDSLPALTVSGWIYPRSVAAASADTFNKRDAAGASGWKFGSSSTGAGRLSFAADHATTQLLRTSSNDVVIVNAWQHVVVTWDGSTIASNVGIYINGIETTYTTTTNGAGARASDAANTLNIGAQPDGGNPFNGLIDEVRVYNRALSPDEVRRLYNMGR